MNKFLVVMGIIVLLAGLFDLWQGKNDWWLRAVQGVGFFMAGIAMQKQK